MKDSELEKIWRSLDSRISTLNERTKSHTIEIKELRKMLIQLEGSKKDD